MKHWTNPISQRSITSSHNVSYIMIRMTVILIAVITACITAKATTHTHAFVVPGYDYKQPAGGATVTTLEVGDLAFRKVNVTNAFELQFNPNSTSGLFCVEDKSKGYGCLGKLIELLFLPYNHITITGIRIYVLDDRSNGIRHGNRTLDYVSGPPARYSWTGTSTSEVSLKVSSSERNAMKFTCIEVDYRNTVSGGDSGDQGGDSGDQGGDSGNQGGDSGDQGGSGNQGGNEGGNEGDKVDPVIIFTPESDAPIDPSTAISLSCSVSTATIYYTTGSGTPSITSEYMYRAPFTLSLPDHMTVTAIAVTPTGRFTTASRTYTFATSNSIESFMANASSTIPTTLTTRLTVAYADRTTAYLTDTDGTYVPMRNNSNFTLVAGDIISTITATISRDPDGFYAINPTTKPSVTGRAAIAPQPVTATPADILSLPLHAYITLADITISDGVAFGKDGRAAWISNKYGAVQGSTLIGKCNLTGFVGLYNGVKCIYPTAVKSLEAKPDDNPDIKTDSCSLAYAAAGGTIEVFAQINDYTLTPVGRPLSMPCKIEKGKSAYAYLIPAEGREFVSAFLDAEIVLPGSPILRTTPYGPMIEIDMSADHQLLVTFGEVNGIDDVNQDNIPTEYYTINGVSLGSTKPSRAGVYIMRQGRTVTKIVIN